MIVSSNLSLAPPPMTPVVTFDRVLDREADARRLSERLLRSDSATMTLLEWCGERMIGVGPIRAVPAAGTGEAVPPELLHHLDARDGEVVRHRRTSLTRGSIGLADLDLWWLPGRLPAALAEALDSTDHPFGLVVAPLRPRRRVVSVDLPGDLPGGRHLVEHQAVVETAGAGGYRPAAVVRERYRVNLARLG